MRFPWRLPAAAVVVCLASPLAVPSYRHVDWRAGGRTWAQGPVWYVMTTAEYHRYRTLRDDSQRRGFIREFWARRDPLPDTDENELEREFWDRVRVADHHFGQDVKPGWKTERGKVFIMLGPPENLERDRILADVWGASRWTYDLGAMPIGMRLVLQECLGVPSDRRFASVRVRGEAEGSRAVGDTTPVADSVLRPTSILPLAEILVRRIPRADALRLLGHLMRVPEVMERSGERVDVTTVFGHVPLRARVDFRPVRGVQGRTLVAVTLGVEGRDLATAGVAPSPSPNPVVTARLTAVDGEQESHALTHGFRPDPSPEVVTAGGAAAAGQVFQAITKVRPGRYLLEALYQDSEGHVSGSVRDVIDVPAFSPRGLGVSSLVLSARLEKLEVGPEPAEGPFTLGRYRVVPRTRQVFDPGEELLIFYEIFGAAVDEDGRPRLDLSYQFYLEDSGRWLPVGAPIAPPNESDLVQAWGVPLAGWPVGRYRLEVTVTDRLVDSTSVRGVLLEIAPPPPAPPAGAGASLLEAPAPF